MPGQADRVAFYRLAVKRLPAAVHYYLVRASDELYRNRQSPSPPRSYVEPAPERQHNFRVARDPGTIVNVSRRTTSLDRRFPFRDRWTALLFQAGYFGGAIVPNSGSRRRRGGRLARSQTFLSRTKTIRSWGQPSSGRTVRWRLSRLCEQAL
jgi:hypothetical protein